jgi:hypothetical protein
MKKCDFIELPAIEITSAECHTVTLSVHGNLRTGTGTL